MSLFNFSGYPIGLDISDTGLKLVELGKKGKKIIFQAVGRADLPPGLVENGQIINQAEIAKKIKNALDQPLFGKFSAATVALSLPEAKSFAKLIYVEKSPNPLPAAVDAEIGKYVPYENDEIFYDWQKIGEDRDRHHIFFSACAKKDFLEYEQLLNAAGLKIERRNRKRWPCAAPFYRQKLPRPRRQTKKTPWASLISAPSAPTWSFTAGSRYYSASVCRFAGKKSPSKFPWLWKCRPTRRKKPKLSAVWMKISPKA